MKTRIQRSLLFGMSLVSLSSLTAQKQTEKKISVNGMQVSWEFQQDRICFIMSAPTDGWVTIGFNETKNMTGAYLLMGRVKNAKSEVVEHFTISPGYYVTVDSLGGAAQIADVSGTQKGKNTLLRFSLPVEAKSKYQKNLSEGEKYIMILAYSRDDDYQHHSIMRTSIRVEL